MHTQKHTSAKHTHKHDPTGRLKPERWQMLTKAQATGWEWDNVREMPESKHVHSHTHRIFNKFVGMIMSQSHSMLAQMEHVNDL